MTSLDARLSQTLPRDLVSGLVVFLVALPLCLGVAVASGAEPFSGILAGIVGGLVVGALSNSQTSVSGPAAGLTAVVAAQITALGSFEAFLAAVVIAGVIQLALGLARGGFLAAYFPSSVIKGLLAAIGVILILKQIPHLLGHDTDPDGEMSFVQPDKENTFTELWAALGDLHVGAMVVGLASLGLLLLWDRISFLKSSKVPAPLVVVVLGSALGAVIGGLGEGWEIGASHLVQVPMAGPGESVTSLLTTPLWSAFSDPKVYVAGLTIALVASLETLLNLEAVDSIDPYKRHSDPNRELLAQGVGNISSGLIGGLPVTSVIIRSSVNIQSGGQTKLSTIVHGVLLVGCVLLLPDLLNQIPLSALAAILLVTGFKLASPKLFRSMWATGKTQFVPFVVTIAAIVFTDLLVGILIGLVNATAYILYSNMRRPLRRFQERHVGGDVLRIELANQVSFLSRAAIAKALDDAQPGTHVMLDATATDFIDEDVLQLIRTFQSETGPARKVTVSLKGFKDHYDELDDTIQFVDYSSREMQSMLSPRDVLEILREGNARFRAGNRVARDLTRQVERTAPAQFPMAAVLSCIDSRAPVELLFDLGLGDVFSVRIAGNIARDKVIGSLEYSCIVAGAKLLLVMGHTSCGAVNASIDLLGLEGTIADATGCHHLDPLIEELQLSVPVDAAMAARGAGGEQKRKFADDVARLNVERTIERIRASSPGIDKLVREGRLGILGAMYDVHTGRVDFLSPTADVPALQITVAHAE
ncbi:MAG: SulP family inorganic anion transporter [Planctomycetota bacterium]|nr:SulP family inorganic anion transporter [Planctomycetota bacterium]MDA1222705.1 SulP family inorganic anion transporter [Planctomycetota bacterium]